MTDAPHSNAQPSPDQPQPLPSVKSEVPFDKSSDQMSTQASTGSTTPSTQGGFSTSSKSDESSTPQVSNGSSPSSKTIESSSSDTSAGSSDAQTPAESSTAGMPADTFANSSDAQTPAESSTLETLADTSVDSSDAQMSAECTPGTPADTSTGSSDAQTPAQSYISESPADSSASQTTGNLSISQASVDPSSSKTMAESSTSRAPGDSITSTTSESSASEMLAKSPISKNIALSHSRKSVTWAVPQTSIETATSQASVDSAPPQPPLPKSVDDGNPPVVDGIDESATPAPTSTSSSDNPAPSSLSAPEAVADLVRPGDLAALSELFARFHTRIEKASAGRKYRPLRDAWDSAADEIARAPDRIRRLAVSDLVIDALRIGCESGKIVIVDACLDCIHRLFEYGHVGSAGESSDISFDVREGALDDLVAIVCACLEVKDEDVYLRMVQTLLTAATRTKSGLHQSTLLAAVRTIYNIFLNARMPGIRTTARVSLTQILNLVFSRMETESAEELSSVSEFSARPPTAADAKMSSQGMSQDTPAIDVPEPSATADDGADPNTEFVSVLQRDAYLLFRALCKLSAKEYVDTNSPDAVGIRSKMLSLELIRNVINNSGPAFRNGDRFIYALRQYLSRSLLINCMWNSAEVMDISFDIFENLLRKDTLRPLLKTEISALFDTVIFRFLESPTAGLLRKRRALNLLSRLSADRQTMADIFLNYDCDIDSPKIFERIVHVVSAAAQNKSVFVAESPMHSSAAVNSTLDMRVVALSSVVQVVRSLREWSKPLENSNEGSYDLEKTSTVDTVNSSDTAHDDSISINLADNNAYADRDKTNYDNEKFSESPAGRSRSSGSNGVAGVVSEGNDRDTTRFEEALKAKRESAEGVKLFNSKPKRGIEYLIKRGRIQEHAEDIAKFLHKAENLDAAMVGEFLGDADSLNISVMHAYTDMYDFTNMAFDGALRLHLSGFRLPGEAQKIDRIMEKFASRYCECNPDIFANADAAYVLAYSTIMLHTDAHNDTIKNKMSKEEFIKNNRGINDGGDLDPLFLGKLYDRITSTEIRLSASKKDSTAGAEGNSLNTATAAATMDPAQRARQFEQESERLMAKMKVLFSKKRRPTQDYTYYSATNVHHARLMFDTAWYPVLAAVSLNLEEATSQDTKVVSLCLEGFRHGIAISSTFSMTTAKDAFVSSLAKFTHLSSIAEMRTKNVECVRMILAIAAMEGDNLGEQWVLIVRAISLLEQIRAVASGNADQYLLQKAPLTGVGMTMLNGSDSPMSKAASKVAATAASSTRNPNMTVPVVSGDTFRRLSSGRTSLSSNSGGSKIDSSQKVDSKAASLATTVPEGEIERIFTNSSNLSASGVSDFCGALCTVALEELSEAPVPRLFCVQKIVEMAYYNMDSRTRIQWGKIWDNMGPFFVSAMCHSNREVAMYAVDALRQLASKFLEKDELSNFAFQRAFLKPFEMCYGRSNAAAIRELVLSCISQIVLARAANIKSGWKSVFAVLALAAEDKVEALMNFGWQIVDSITRKYVGILEDVYVDAVTGISAYTKTMLSTPVSLAAIDLLSGRCAACLVNWAKTNDEDSGKRDNNAPNSQSMVLFSGDDDGHIGLWFPILTGLASAMQDERKAVRHAANSGLFKVLNDHGGHFAPSMWILIFRGVLSPIFDDVRHLFECQDKNEAAIVAEWATTTGVSALQSFVDVLVLHLSLARVILDDLLGLIRSWILQENETVAREGMSILARLIMCAGDVFSKEDWKKIITSVTNTFIETMPHEIVGSSMDEINSDKRVMESGRSDMHSLDGKKAEDGHEDEQEKVQDSNVGKPLNGHNETENEVEDSGNEAKIDFRVVRAKCVVQLLLIEVVQEVVVSFYNKLQTEDILSMSECLEMSYRFANKFNADIELRYSLWRTGFMNQVPNLLKQETNGLMAYLRIMFWLYLDEKREDMESWSEDKMMELCESVLRRYIHACEEAPSKSEERREVAALSPVVSFIVNSVMQMSEQQFKKHLDELYRILLDLLDSCDDRNARRTVTKLLRARIMPTIGPYVGRAQLPDTVRQKILKTKVVADESVQADDEICSAVLKVGGVRSVKPVDSKANQFILTTSAPDEMVVAGAMSLAFVRAAFVEEVDSGQLD